MARVPPIEAQEKGGRAPRKRSNLPLFPWDGRDVFLLQFELHNFRDKFDKLTNAKPQKELQIQGSRSQDGQETIGNLADGKGNPALRSDNVKYR
jgi:hypothetical protein